MPLPPLIVVPTFNEIENLPELIERIFAVMNNVHLWIVDDASPDGTADAAERLLVDREGSLVYRRTGERGLGRAYCDAFQRALLAGYTTIVQMDADLSHDPAHLPALIAATSTCDLAIGSRYVRGGGVRAWPLRRILLSRGANLYVRLITGLPVNDATSGFRCWTAKALTAVDLATMNARGYAFQVGMAYRAFHAGIHLTEVPIVFTDRKLGSSKLSGTVFRESVLVPWLLRFGRC